jgi:hypothetical protein
MEDHSERPRERPVWERPDFCPFCGRGLADGGAGFIDHLIDAPECEERFDAWRERVTEDIGGEWGG